MAHNWEVEHNGKKTKLFTLINKNNLKATITNFGAKLVSLEVPDRDGNLEDIVLGYDNIEDTISGDPYFGATIGRFGNRIANGKFTIDGVEYTLEQNNGDNALHGGIVGYNAIVWDAAQEGNKVVLSHLDPDMHEGYPGNVKVSVTYELTDENELKISYEATTDKKTHINLTHHSYFNLKGAGNGNILDHELEINADTFTPINAGQIPTGEVIEVKGSPFDFSTPTLIGKNIDADNQIIKNGFGFDHNWVINGKFGELRYAATAIEPKSGRVMKVYTTEPGMQLYTGNFIDNDTGKGGKKYDYREAFCLETQHFPDAPNKDHFPSTLVLPSEKYETTTVYKFEVK